MLGQLKALAIGAAVLLPIMGFMYWQIADQKEAIESYIEREAQMEIAIQSRDSVIEKTLSSIDRWESAQNALVIKVEEMRQVSIESGTQNRRLNETFAKHNLSKIAARKPHLLENRINRGTRDAFRMLKCASGSRDKDCGSSSETAAAETESPKSGANSGP